MDTEFEQKKNSFIELFAGCGGLSLGLEAAGFNLMFANELSPMAGETYAYNILRENLKTKSQNKEKEISTKVLWIKSQFKENNLKERLRENPFEMAKGKNSDIDRNTVLQNKLLIGNIDYLLDFLNENKDIANSIRKHNIDLLSGGPPCQSFSLAGKREKNNEKNLLPLSFAKFAGLVKPKVILLENVKGILSPFIEKGFKYYAWLEVSKAFALEGFVPICMLLNSKYFGIPQNRPRFILLAFRKDIFDRILIKNKDNTILKVSKDFFTKVQNNKNELKLISIKDFKYYDIEINPELYDGKLLPKLTHTEKNFITAAEAISDIRRTEISYKLFDIRNKYKELLNQIFINKNISEDTLLKNHEPRNHKFYIKARFRFFQVINQFQNGLKKDAIDLFTGKKLTDEVINELFSEFANYNLLFKKEGREFYMKPNKIDEVEQLVKSIPTKKHSQRALEEFEPAPAQMTIPDDLCHYAAEEPRTLTVREMARFQSFPDWFIFRSKITTGGNQRRFEVPQYTQVGNAVPPLLALELGNTIFKLLRSIE